MRIIMTGGGTGGHIYPAIAIADKIKEEHPEAEILFIGTRRGLESTVVPKHGYAIQFVEVHGFNRKNMLKNVKVVWELAKGYRQSIKILKEFRPDLVVGTGGYVCGPVVSAANHLGIKTCIHEQNAFPGLTNRLLEKKASKVFVGFPEAIPHFKHKEKIVVSGNPVRKVFYHLDKELCRNRLGIAPADFVLLTSGGSGGAGRLNEEILNIVKYFREALDVSIFFVTGRVYYKGILERLKEMGMMPSDKLHVMEYITDIHEYMGAADLVVGRAGALTVAEITVSGKACVLIPSPNVTGNHQFHNAKAVSDCGGAVLLEEKDLRDNKLAELIAALKENKNRRMNMEDASKSCSSKDATEIICREIFALVE